MICSMCGDWFTEPDPSESIVSAGGWCAPSEIAYSMPEPAPECPDCKSRMMMMMTIGIDPGKNGEDIRAYRGGIKYRGQG